MAIGVFRGTNPFRPFQEDPNNPLSSTIGSAAQQGLDVLLQHKMQKMQQEKTSEALRQFKDAAGNPLFNPQEANALTALSPQERMGYVKQKLQASQQEDFLNRYGQMQGLSAIESAPNQQRGIQRPSPEDWAQYQKQLQGYQQGQEIFGNNPPAGSLGMPEEPQAQRIQPQPKQRPNFNLPPGVLPPRNPKEAMDIAKIQQKERFLEIKQKNLERKESREEQLHADKETKPLFDAIMAEEKVAKDSDAHLGRMLNIIKEGVPDPIFYKTLKDFDDHLSPLYTGAGGAAGGAKLGLKFGIPGAIVGAIGGGLAGLAVKPLVNLAMRALKGYYPNTDEFEKLSADYVKYAKPFFGNKLTDQDLKAFLATVPTLMQTDHGKKAVARNIQITNEAVHTRYKAMKKIIKENGGKRPKGLGLIIEEIVEPRLQQLADDFKKGIYSAPKE